MNTPARPEQETLLKDALRELRRLRAEVAAHQAARLEPIAIVGIGCRFPGTADTPARFWRNLCDGVDAISEVPPDRWDVDRLYDPDPDAPGKICSRYGGFISDIDRFDAAFFGISPREAVSLDPQQRLLLEVSWEAFENANLPPDQLFESDTGVFVGMCTFDFALWRARQPANWQRIDAYYVPGSVLSLAAGRLSYTLGLTGPCMVVDTACSSSLVSIHLACQSLRSGECRQALAGGVNLILAPELSINFSRAHMLAKDGRCKTFDAAADGYVRGEGCGVVVLKRLSDALHDGDNVTAVIRGSAINQDGPSGGLTVPSGPSQEKVIRQALARARVEPRSISYVEAHGTGTPLGDPIEVGALAAVFAGDRQGGSPLYIGSVKTQLGHLEGAAGVASLIKTALALRHGQIPPNLHFRTANPHIPWHELSLQVPVGLTPWPDGEGPRLAGVSSFGMSGTNAHIVLGEAPQAASLPETGPQSQEPMLVEQVLTLSAKTPSALTALAARYVRYLSEISAAELGASCHASRVGRSHFQHRLAVVADTRDEMRRQLEEFVASGAGVWQGRVDRTSVTRGGSDSQLAAAGPASRSTPESAVAVGPAEAPQHTAHPEHERAAHLAARYVQEESLDWSGVDGGQHRRSATLPTYPFQRERFWIETAPPEQAVDLSNWYYEVAWEPRPLTAESQSTDSLPGDWIIFADREGVGREVACLLQARGDGAIEIVPHDGASAGAAAVRIDSRQPTAFGDLLQGLLSTKRRPVKGVIYLWPLDETWSEDRDGSELVDLQARQGENSLHLLNALVARSGSASLPVVWVTRGACPVAGPVSSAGLVQTPLWGLGKVIALEHPTLDSRNFDLDPLANPLDDAARLVAELQHADGENQVAIRDGQRYAARLVPLREAPLRPIAVRADASYLITGGLGTLGLHVARWLVGQGARSLVLVGRHAPTLAVRTTLAALARSGARVELLQADVADEREMRRVISTIADTLPPLRGIVHAAGVDGQQLLRELDSQGLARVLHPKVAGAWTLHRLTCGQPLDFLVCYSSIASIWGSKAQGAYSAANQFLDAFATYRSARGLPTLSVNWGPWAGGGMVSAAAEEHLARIGVRTLAPELALQALREIWSCDRSGAVVARVDWRQFKEVVAASARVGRLFEQVSAIAPQEGAEPGPRPADWLGRIADATSEERRSILEQYVAGELARVLGAGPAWQIDPDLGFFELGMDSLMSVALKRRLEQGLGIHLPETLAFDYPTLARLTDYLLATHVAVRETCEPLAIDGAVEFAKARPQLTEAEAEAALINKLEQLEY